MPPYSARLLAVAFLVIGLPLAGCGDAKQSAGTPAAVKQDITKALTSTNKDDCKLSGYATRKFIDQYTLSLDGFADLAARNCRKFPKAFVASSVKVSRVKVDGDHAVARIEPRGGQYAFGTLDVDLARDGTWKLDAFTAIRVDRGRYLNVAVDSPSVNGGEITASQRSCVVRRLGRFSDAALGKALVSGDLEPTLDPLLLCAVRPELRKAGGSVAAVGCVVRRLRNQGRKLLEVAGKDDSKAVRRLIQRAADECAGGDSA